MLKTGRKLFRRMDPSRKRMMALLVSAAVAVSSLSAVAAGLTGGGQQVIEKWTWAGTTSAEIQQLTLEASPDDPVTPDELAAQLPQAIDAMVVTVEASAEDAEPAVGSDPALEPAGDAVEESSAVSGENEPENSPAGESSLPAEPEDPAGQGEESLPGGTGTAEAAGPEPDPVIPETVTEMEKAPDPAPGIAAAQVMLPVGTLAGSAGESTTRLALTWDPVAAGYPAEGAYEGTYTLTAGIPEGYILGDAAAQPAVSVTIEAKKAEAAEDGADSSADTVVSTVEALRTAIADAPVDKPYTIVIGADLTVTSETMVTIPAGRQIILVDDGTARTIYGSATTGGFSLITIEEGASLTLRTSVPGDDSLLVLDNANAVIGSGSVCELIHTCGEFILEGGTLQNNTANTYESASINVNGSSASFNMSGGRITGNAQTNQNAGIIYISGGAVFNLTGGSIDYNTLDDNPLFSAIIYVTGASHFTMSGGSIAHNTDAVVYDFMEQGFLSSTSTIYIEAKDGDSSFTLSGGTISDNLNYYGTVLLGTNSTSMDYDAMATMTMDGGTISNNTALYSGGGVFVNGRAQFTLNNGDIILSYEYAFDKVVDYCKNGINAKLVSHFLRGLTHRIDVKTKELNRQKAIEQIFVDINSDYFVDDSKDNLFYVFDLLTNTLIHALIEYLVLEIDINLIKKKYYAQLKIIRKGIYKVDIC